MDGLLYRTQKLRLIIPDALKNLQMQLVKHAHDSLVHPGYHGTHSRVCGQYFWREMDKSVERFVKQCNLCQKAKHSTHKAPGFLLPMVDMCERFEWVHLDLLAGMTKVQGFDQILCTVDRATRRVKLAAAASTDDAPTLAKRWLDSNTFQHGVWPRYITTDLDSRFDNEFLKSMTDSYGIGLSFATAYRHESNGICERQIRTLRECLRVYIYMLENHKDTWVEDLGAVEYALNARFHSSVGAVPFELDRGMPLWEPTTLNAETRVTGPVSYQQFTEQLRSTLYSAHSKVLRQADDMVLHYDKHRSSLELSVGEEVLVRSEHMMPRLNSKRLLPTKLMPAYLGPFKVLEACGNDNYRLNLPDYIRGKSDKFHVSRLRKFVARDKDIAALFEKLPNPQVKDGVLKYNIHEIVKHITNGQGHTKYLCTWEGYSADHSTWEPRRSRATSNLSQ